MLPDRRFVAVLLALVVLGWVGALVSGNSGAVVGTATPTPTPVATATATAGVTREVTTALGRVQRAFDAGDVARLCRPGVLVDPA